MSARNGPVMFTLSWIGILASSPRMIRWVALDWPMRDSVDRQPRREFAG